MTIAIGLLCTEGAVLLCDSMTVKQTPTGAEGFLSTEGKIGVLPELGLAFVHSGHGEQPHVDVAGGFEANARALFAAYAEIPRPVFADTFVGSHRDTEPDPRELRRISAQELIVATIPSGRMAFLDLDLERWTEMPRLFIAGAPTTWAIEQGLHAVDVPTSLDAAADMAVEIARAFIEHHYAGRTLAAFAAEGIIPPVAFPLHLIGVAGSTVRRKEIVS